MTIVSDGADFIRVDRLLKSITVTSGMTGISGSRNCWTPFNCKCTNLDGGPPEGWCDPPKKNVIFSRSRCTRHVLRTEYDHRGQRVRNLPRVEVMRRSQSIGGIFRATACKGDRPGR